jgi:hypothetical protein
VGVNLRTIQRMEANGVASLKTRGALAKALGVKPEDLDVGEGFTAAHSDNPIGRWRLLVLANALVVCGAVVLGISIKSAVPIGLVTLLAVGGLLVALIGFAILTRLTPLRRWRIYAVLCILAVSMAASPPAWTVRALVAISLWIAFELGILATRLQVRMRHS